MNSIFLAYILVIFFFIWFFTFLSYFIMKRKQQKLLQNLRDNWGVPYKAQRNYNLIENFTVLNNTPVFHTLNKQTIADIDLHELFEYTDRTNSKPGQQYLYHKLLTPTDNIAELERFNEQVNFFSQNKQIREEVQLLFSPLNHHDAYYITNLLDSNLLQQPKWSVLYTVDSVLVISMLILSIWFPVLLLWLIAPFAINIFLYFRNKNSTAGFNRSFPQLNSMINVCKLLLKKDLPFEHESIQKSTARLKGFQRKFKLLGYGEKSQKDEIAQTFLFFLELTKAFFLTEIHIFFNCLKQLKNKQEDIRCLFTYIGSVDAAISTASLREKTSGYCTPVFSTDKKELCAKNVYHPLVEDCVKNSIEINGKSILITGSNMSGKSTFIRTIAINSVLAQTIYTCFADAFTTPVLKLSSSIRITDNLMDAKSYYFEEVNVIGELLKEAITPFQHLYILDEIFKGTNTIERVAAAKAVLSYLNKNNNIVFVSTHDIELAELLVNEFDLYHFVEDIKSDQLVFDHKLKTGPLKTRNAIKLLALSGYPAEIIAEAGTIANKN